MDIKIKSTLKELGLTDGEIRVYLALVELGSVTVGPIIDKAQISSSKVYVILEKLIQKGLANYIIKEKTKYFQASQPVSLLDYVELKEKKVKETKVALNDVISKIQVIQEASKETEEARIYRGYKALKTAWLEAIKTIPKKGEYYFISVGYGEDPFLKRFFGSVARELKKKKIKIRGIANVKEKKLYRQFYEKLGYDMKYTKMVWPSDLSVAGNFLIIFVWDKKEPVIYSIQSKTLVKSYLQFLKNIILKI